MSNMSDLRRNLPLNGKMERLPERYAPYIGHINDGSVLLTDRSHMAMIRLEGSPFELTSTAVRKNRALIANDLLRTLPVDLVSIHCVKHEVPPVVRPYEYDTQYGRTVMARYNETALGEGVRAISWFMSLIVRPSAAGILARKNKSQILNDQDAADQLEYAVRIAMGSLSEYSPKRLIRKAIDTEFPDEKISVSEVGSALFLIRTGLLYMMPSVDVDYLSDQDGDVPETTGTLGSAVLHVSPEFGHRSFDLMLPGRERYGAMLSLKDYPSRTRPGMFNDLLKADFCFSITQSFSYENQRWNKAALEFRESHLSNVGGGSEDLLKGLTALKNETSSNKSTTGMHNFAMAVFSPDYKKLGRHVGTAMAGLTRFGGANIVQERNVWWNGAMEAQYWTLLPGVTWTHCRSGQISTLNLAHMASLDGYTAGQKRGYWGRSPFRLRSRAGTAINFIPGIDDVMHMLVAGINGSGKTVFMSFLKTAMAPVLGKNGLRILIDKDGSNRISIIMEGGAYATLRRNVDSGVAPLKFLEDTPRNRAFFHALYSWLITRDGGRNLTNDEDAGLVRGIARQLKMPKHLRSMGGVREFLGYKDRINGAGARFEKWCAGNSMGWLLDGNEHLIDLDPSKALLYGFDLGALIPKEGAVDDGACQAIAAVLMHQLGDLMDGRRIMAIFEECRFYLEPLAKMIDDLVLTGRKNEVMVVPVIQQPEHILDSPLGMSIMSQCRTKILFPNKSADRNTYVNRLNLTPQAYDQLSSKMFVGEKCVRFLLWRGEDESGICDFDLSKMPNELAIMSARARSNRLLDQILATPGISDAEIQERFLTENNKQLAILEEDAQ